MTRLAFGAGTYSGRLQRELEGLPRDSYRFITKVTTRDGVNPAEKIDELRRLANTEYLE